MKKKIVLRGTDENDKKILIGLELKAKENQVNVYTFEEDKVTELFYNQMMEDWRNGREVEFPDGYQTIIRELSLTEDILPETIKVQRGDLINRAKTEWHFVVLSTKLYDMYNTELEDLKDKIDRLVDFDKDIWEETRTFWSKIADQARERNLFRDHADKLKDGTNELFTKMKDFRNKANEELKKVSKEHLDKFMTRLDAVKQKVDDGKSLNPLFDELKKIQNEFRDTTFTRGDKSKVWKKIDAAFKMVKEKKYGTKASDSTGLSRVERRQQGLLSAIGKMQASIDRDQRDIDFQNKRVSQTDGQLEAQIRQAKIKMIEGRIASKQDKLNEMLATQKDLEKRIVKEKEREAAKAEKKAIAQKQAELKQKFKAEAAENKPEISEEKAKQLEAAAADINRPKKKAQPKKGETQAEDKAETTEVGEVISKIGETPAVTSDVTDVVADTEKESIVDAVKSSVTDAVDTIKATASVVGEKLEDKVSSLADTAKEVVEDVKEDVSEGLSDTAESGEKKSGGLLGAVVAAGSNLVKEAKEKIEEVAEDVGLDKAMDKAKEVIADAKEEIKEKVEDAQSAISEAKEEIKEEVAEASDTKDSLVADATEAIKKGGILAAAAAAGNKLVSEAKEKLSEVADDLDLDDTIAKAKETLAETTEAIKGKVADVKDDLTPDVTVEEVAERIKSESEEE